MTEQRSTPAYGRIWFNALACAPSPIDMQLPDSVLLARTVLDDEPAELIAIVPDPQSRFRRARKGQMGLEQGWGFAEAIGAMTANGAAAGRARTPIVVVVDVPGQAYGYLEELVGIHQALAAAAAALARARLAGHPVTALVVGSAVSGAFLAIGLQANRIVALDHDAITVQVMSKQATARITKRSVDELDALAAVLPATAYDGRSFARLGAVSASVPVGDALHPTGPEIASVLRALAEASAQTRADGTSLRARLASPEARLQRAASIEVRRRVAREWR
ncbi:biotin-independent malonate decarboxylase subunit gamma [Streptomyces sp. NPDC055037]